MKSTEMITPLAGEFAKHYGETEGGSWGGGSGAGSNPYTTIPYRAFLESFIRLNGIVSMVDVGCGDWRFSRFLDLTGIDYLGLDIVPNVISTNIARFGNPAVRFGIMPDDVSVIPQADLLVVKDVLQHLNTKRILEMKETYFPASSTCLLTNSYEKLNTPRNTDIVDGSFRCLDLSEAPFSFDGSYVLEFTSPLWERIRTYLYRSKTTRASVQSTATRKAAVGNNLIMLQTSDPFVYRPLLDVTSRANIEYCSRNGFGYESYIGIKSGVVPWMASYNRIFMLNELVQRGHRGWVIFADADAFVADLGYDVRHYLTTNSEYRLIGATGGSEAPWNINSGILFINFGDPTGRAFVADWMERFENEVPSELPRLSLISMGRISERPRHHV